MWNLKSLEDEPRVQTWLCGTNNQLYEQDGPPGEPQAQTWPSSEAEKRRCKQAEAMAAMEPHFQVWLQCPCCAACSMAWDNAVGPWIHQLELVDAPMAEKVVRHEDLDAHKSDDVLDSDSAVGIDDGDSAPVDEHLFDDGVAAVEMCMAGVLRTPAQKLSALSWKSNFRVVGKQEAVATAPATCKRAQRGSKRGRGSGKAALRPAQHEDRGWAGECRAIDGSTAWRLQWVLAAVLVCGMAGFCVLVLAGGGTATIGADFQTKEAMIDDKLKATIGADSLAKEVMIDDKLKATIGADSLAKEVMIDDQTTSGLLVDMQHKLRKARAKGNLADAFTGFDADGSGEIELAELELGMKALGKNLQIDEIKKELSDADIDGSGTLNYEEFVVLST